MKAKEYYAKYHDGILSKDEEASNHAICSFINELSHETIDIIKQRRAQRVSAITAVFEQQNQKYNAVMSLFVSKDGFQPLISDGFIIHWRRAYPELAIAMNMQANMRRCRR